MISWQTGLNDAIDAIYASAITPSQTPAMLERIADLFGAMFVDSYACSHDRSQRSGIVFGLDDDDYQNGMLGTWAGRNVWGSKAPVRLAGEVKSTREMVPVDELVRSEMYQDYLRPRGLHEGMRIAVWSDENGIEDVSLLRSWSRGAFGTADLATGRLLFPHLQRASAVRRRLSDMALGVQIGLATLHTLHSPVVLIDRDGAATFVNQAAEDLLSLDDGLTIKSSRLVAATPAGTTRLGAALNQAIGAAGRPLAATLRLPRPSGARALSLVAMPLPRAAPWLGSKQPVVLLSVGGPAIGDPAAANTAATYLVHLFGLTASEAAVAAHVMTGLEPAEIARATGRSLATVRTHLANLMEKTNTTRHTQLVRLLLACPRAS